MLRRSLIAALSLAAIVLSGCTDTTRIPPADPTPTDAPLFSSDEEALAAATEVYEEYVEVVDRELADPSGNGSALNAIATGQALAAALEGVQEFRRLEWVSVGVTELRAPQFQMRERSEVGEYVSFYVCEDLAGVDVLGPDGESVVQDDRDPVTAFEVGVEFSVETDPLVTRRDLWTGAISCT